MAQLTLRILPALTLIALNILHSTIALIWEAYYMSSLFLVSVCRSLPEIDVNNPSESQNKDLISLFHQVERALKNGTLSWGTRNTEIDQIFTDANIKLEVYINKYRIILKKWWENQIEDINSFEMATQRDFEAIEQLKKYKQGLEKEIFKLANRPCVKLDIIIWMREPTKLLSNGPHFVFRENTHAIGRIKIEDTASFDILMHRVIEYTVLANMSNISIQLRNIMALELYPQFYEEFPTQVTFFHNGMKKIPSIKPWEKVSKVNGPLHIIMNHARPQPPASNRKKSFLSTPGGRIEIPDSYSNAWLLQSDETPNSIAPGKVAVRQRTTSHSLCLWNVPSTNISTEDQSTMSESDPIPMPAISSVELPSDQASMLSDGNSSYATARSTLSISESIYGPYDNDDISLYSRASSRTAETDYGLYYRRRALSQTTLDSAHTAEVGRPGWNLSAETIIASSRRNFGSIIAFPSLRE